MEDRYIGLLLAVASAIANGSSFIITKKGLNDAGARNKHGTSASDNLAYLKNPIWWAGISTHFFAELLNFAAYTFAPAILVTPLGALAVIVGAVLASFLLNERLGHLGRISCTMCLLGAVIIILHAPEDRKVSTVDEILHFALQPGFMMYCFAALVFCLYMIYVASPRYGRTNPLVYISICSLAGSVSVMAIKGFGVAVKLTFEGKNQFTSLSTYVFGITIAGCIMVQMNYFNKALDTFSTNVVNPMYFVCFSTATIVASLILFQGFNTDNATNTLSLIIGFVITFLGVHLLNVSRAQEERADDLEMDLAMEPPEQDRDHGSPPNSSYPTQHTTLFNALDTDGAPRETTLYGHHQSRTDGLHSSNDDVDSDDNDHDQHDGAAKKALLQKKSTKSVRRNNTLARHGALGGDSRSSHTPRSDARTTPR